MNASPRRTIVLTAPQSVWLEDEAKRLGVSVNEVIRRLIDVARGATQQGGSHA